MTLHSTGTINWQLTLDQTYTVQSVCLDMGTIWRVLKLSIQQTVHLYRKLTLSLLLDRTVPSWDIVCSVLWMMKVFRQPHEVPKQAYQSLYRSNSIHNEKLFMLRKWYPITKSLILMIKNILKSAYARVSKFSHRTEQQLPL